VYEYENWSFTDKKATFKKEGGATQFIVLKNSL